MIDAQGLMITAKDYADYYIKTQNAYNQIIYKRWSSKDPIIQVRKESKKNKEKPGDYDGIYLKDTELLLISADTKQIPTQTRWIKTAVCFKHGAWNTLFVYYEPELLIKIKKDFALFQTK